MILIAFLIIAPGSAVADGMNQYTTPDGYQNVTVSEAKKLIDEGNVFILDVRTPDEFYAGHIEGATMIPLQSLKNPDEPRVPDSDLLVSHIKDGIGLPTDKSTFILVYCRTGTRSATASKMLVTADYTNVYNMNEGIKTWIDAGYPIVVTFVSEMNGLDQSTKNALNTKLYNVLHHLEKGDDDKAKEKINLFSDFVDEMLTEGRVDSNEKVYLNHESSVHLKELI
jgi:rhodanese-related sulfurtransferase